MKTFYSIVTAAVIGFIALATVPAQASGVNFTAFGGFIGVDGSATYNATFAQGYEALGGDSFGKTETFANAASNFAVGTQVGLQFNAIGNSGSSSVSGSLVNGNGAAWNQTGGVGISAAGFGGLAGGGISW